MKQTRRVFRSEQGEDIAPAGGFTEKRHPPRVATKSRDVLPHPAQRLQEIQEREIPRSLGAVRRRVPQCRVTEPAQGAEPIVEGNHQQPLLLHEARRIVEAGGTDTVAAPMDKHHHRQCRIRGRVGRGKDIQTEAVFLTDQRTHSGIAEEQAAGELRAHGAIAQGRTRSAPGRRRLWRAPAPLSKWRGGVGYAEPDLRSRGCDTTDQGARHDIAAGRRVRVQRRQGLVSGTGQRKQARDHQSSAD